MSRLQELIAELCPDGVEYKALGDALVRTANIKWAEHRDEEYQYIDLTSVSRVGHRIESTETIDAQSAPSRAQQIVSAGDILFGATRPTLMRYCEVPQEYDGQIASTGYAVFRLNTSIAIPRFVMHCLGTDEFMAHLETYQKGSAYPAISMRDLKKFRIPVPPIEVQREVVRILDEYTSAHDELVRQLEEEMVLREQSDALSFQRYLDEWIGTTSEIMMLKELVLPGRKISYGIVQPGEGGTGDLGVIRPIDIKNSRINVGGIKYVDRSKEDGYQRTKLQGGEILVVVRGTTGEIAVAPDECKGMNVTRGIAVIATNDSVVDRGYLFDFLRGESAQRYIANNTRGTALRQINISDLEKLKIPVLRDSLREMFAEARSKAQTMSDAHHRLIHELSTEISLENQRLSQIRNQLLSFPEKAAKR